MATFDPTNPRFKGFDLIQATYKRISNHAIRVDVLVPQTPATAERPTIVRFHGGGLVMADSLYHDFWPQWLSDLALSHNAIIVSPNYRLMPQATSLEIYDDIEDFWAWLKSPAFSGLLSTHNTPTQADLDRILVSGESAGGLLSVNTSLTHASEIRATIALYPSLDPSAPEFSETRGKERLPFGLSTPETVIDEALAKAAIPECGPVSSLIQPDWLGVMCAAIEHGKIGAWYVRGSEGSGRQDLLFPVRRLEGPDVGIPRGGITVIHGAQDSVVPVAHPVPFVERARQVFKGRPGGDRIAMVVHEGEHGFDTGVRYEEPWMKEALSTAVEAWLE
ncbi:uncharacterized protein DSM5745_00047 [Aspergillus mulundensis]|uniref:Alpha/beta hydrolase fold-3 domain-containing protein n=1 Tax=Aspergillus mulundensis TaxID=1810919 RepID=A0A3D8T2D3_9EURO|nr:Uncharacterized protein DSM5745_00047 [Aspergillus mulundensis]RDW92725.1 Uncharacterized protein DSM5745_00047 [Aspergillus mulundensis]